MLKILTLILDFIFNFLIQDLTKKTCPMILQFTQYNVYFNVLYLKLFKNLINEIHVFK